jgi:hypothetical protein
MSKLICSIIGFILGIIFTIGAEVFLAWYWDFNSLR